MAFLVIDDHVDNIIADLEEKVEANTLLVKKYNKPEYERNLKVHSERLKIAQQWKAMNEIDAEYQKIVDLKFTEPNKFIEKARALIKDIKGIDFNKVSGKFRVRVYINGKQEFLGEEDSPQEAIGILRSYLEAGYATHRSSLLSSDAICNN